MSDNSIARVYQFLSNNYSSIEEWKKEIDERYGNGDGTLIKAEYNSFMLNEFNFDTDDNPNDIINRFWASIDTKVSGTVEGTKISNVNALDADELKNAEALLQISNEINKFMENKPGEDIGVSSSKMGRWRNSVKEGMLNKIAEKLKGKSVDDLDIQKEIEDAYQLTVRKATADYAKDDVIATEIINNPAFQGIDYDIEKDKQLRKIVENYIKSLDGNTTKSLRDIVAEVTKLVQAYAETAKTNKQEAINTLGSSYNQNGSLNDLQKAVLAKQITDGINEKLKSDEYKELREAYGDMITAKITPFVQKQLQSKKASEFTTIKNDISTYVNAFFTSDDGIKAIEKEYQELQDAKARLESAKATLKSELEGKYIEKYKTAFVEVFGASTQSEVEAVIDSYTDEATVAEKSASIKAKIQAIDDKPVEVTDKTVSIFDALGTNVNQEGRLVFRVLNDGTVEFVTGDKSNIYCDKRNEAENTLFNTTVKNEIFKQYQEELDALFGDDTKSKDNLFNIALLTALESASDLYRTVNLRQIITQVIRNFAVMLEKAASDSSAKDYVKYYQTLSLFAGRTIGTDGGNYHDDVNGTMTKDMRDYYTDNTTGGNDDWISQSLSTTTKTYTDVYGSGSILYISSGKSEDDDVINRALENVLSSYIGTYKDYVSVDTIISKFKEAEEKAFSRLNKFSGDESVYRNIYGYGDGGKHMNTSNIMVYYNDYDTYNKGLVSVQAVLMQVMFEMDGLMNKAILGV